MLSKINEIHKTMKIYFIDNQIPQLVNDGAKLDRYLFARHVPLEQTEIYSIKKQIERDILSKKSEGDSISKLGELNKKKYWH